MYISWNLLSFRVTMFRTPELQKNIQGNLISFMPQQIQFSEVLKTICTMLLDDKRQLGETLRSPPSFTLPHAGHVTNNPAVLFLDLIWLGQIRSGPIRIIDRKTVARQRGLTSNVHVDFKCIFIKMSGREGNSASLKVGNFNPCGLHVLYLRSILVGGKKKPLKQPKKQKQDLDEVSLHMKEDVRSKHETHRNYPMTFFSIT